MAEFYHLKVSELIKEAAGTVVISLDIPEELHNKFEYTQGQYLTFRKFFEETEVRRSYSLCSSPLENKVWKVAVKKVEGGLFSQYANEDLKVGDVLEVMAPMGNFFSTVKSGQKKNYVAFAAGSGITPVISIIKTVLQTETESTFTLYYGNRDTHSVIFKNELEGLVSSYNDRFKMNLVFSSGDGGDFTGRITPELCGDFANSNPGLYKADEYFLCGPEKMIFDVQDLLTSKGIDPKKVHFELFNTPVNVESSNDNEAADGEEIESDVTVIIDGDEISYKLSSAGDAILDGALDAGADVPFSCKGAVCCTCRAKLVEGKVHMEMNYALTDEEVEDGYILTCQSHPRTAKVVVDYDAD